MCLPKMPASLDLVEMPLRLHTSTDNRRGLRFFEAHEQLCNHSFEGLFDRLGQTESTGALERDETVQGAPQNAGLMDQSVVAQSKALQDLKNDRKEPVALFCKLPIGRVGSLHEAGIHSWSRSGK